MRTSRSRASLLWGVVFFLGVQLGSLVVEERWRPELREPEYGHKLVILRQRLAAEPDRPLVLVLGSSRTEIGLRPDLIAGSSAGRGSPLIFNFGLPGAGPLQELLCLHRLLREGIRPTWVLIEVLPPVLHGRARWDGDLERVAWGDLDVLSHHSAQRVGLYGDWAVAHAAPWFVHRFCLMNHVAPTWLPWRCRQDYVWKNLDDCGWMDCHFKPDNPAAYRRRLDEVRQEYARYFVDFHVNGLPDRCLRELLDLCRREGIPAVLVLLPEGSEFRSWYPPSALAQIDGFLTELRRDFGVAVVNAREWLPDEEFADSHHQFPEGGTRFSRRLADEVIRPRLGH